MIPQEFINQIVLAFENDLRKDESWRGDLSDNEREILIQGFCRFFNERCNGKSGCDVGDLQSRIKLTLRVFAHTNKGTALNIAEE